MAINLGSAYGEIQIDTSGVMDASRDMDSAMKRMGDSWVNLGERMTAVGGRMTAAITLPLAGLGAAALKTAADMEQTRVAFEVMLGGAQEAERALSSLYDFAATTPFQTNEVVAAGRTLLNFGSTLDTLEDDLRMVGDIAAGTNQPLEEMVAIFGKIRVSGRVGMDDINQLAERGVPIYRELAAVLEVNESEVRKLVESGKVMDDEITAVFQNLTSEGGQYAGMMEAQSQTMAGLFSTLQSNVTMSLGRIGEALVETFDMRRLLGEAINVLDDMTNQLLRFIETEPQLFAIFATLGGAAAAAGPLLIVIGQIASGIGAAMPVISALGAILTGPIGLALAAAAAALLAYQTNFMGIGDVVDSWLETVGHRAQWMLDGFLELWDSIQRGQNVLGDLAMALGNVVFFFTNSEAAGVQAEIMLADLFEMIQEGAEKWLPILAAGFWEVVGVLQEAAATYLPIVQQAFTDLLTFLIEAWPTVQATIEGVFSVLAPIFNFFATDVIPFFLGEFMKIVNFFREDWQNIVEPFQAVLDYFIIGSQMLAALLVFTWQTFGDDILNIMSLLWEGVKTVISLAVDVILGISRVFWRALNGDWWGALEALVQLFTETWAHLVELVGIQLDLMLALFGTSTSEILTIIIEWLISVGDEVQGRLTRTWDWVKDSVSGLIGSLRELWNDFKDVGGYLIDGMTEGVNNAVRSLVDSVVAGMGQAVESAKAFLGIESPSRKAAAEIGAPLMSGVARGIMQQAGELAASLNAGSGLALAAATPSAGDTVNNYNVRADFAGANISSDVDIDNIAERIAATISRRT